MSDEAHFHLTGLVNKHNCRYWSDRHPRELAQKPLHSSKVTVWCVVAAFAIIGPYLRTNVKMLALWPLSVMRTCYRTSSLLVSKVFQWTKPLTFNKMGLQVTLQKLQWTFCAHFFLDISFPDMPTLHGQQDHLTYRCVIFTCGATLRVWCMCTITSHNSRTKAEDTGRDFKNPGWHVT